MLVHTSDQVEPIDRQRDKRGMGGLSIEQIPSVLVEGDNSSVCPEEPSLEISRTRSPGSYATSASNSPPTPRRMAAPGRSEECRNAVPPRFQFAESSRWPVLASSRRHAIPVQAASTTHGNASANGDHATCAIERLANSNATARQPIGRLKANQSAFGSDPRATAPRNESSDHPDARNRQICTHSRDNGVVRSR